MKRNKIQKFIAWAGCHGKFDWLSDEKYLKLMFWARMSRKLNLENPQLFNEKIQWLKLNDRQKNMFPL